MSAVTRETQAQRTTGEPLRKLVFGTAQLGLRYGIANSTGQPSLRECEALLKTAIESGIEYIDTARAYGESEATIGRALRDGWMRRVRVVTKLSPLQDCHEGMPVQQVRESVDDSVLRSCRALGTVRLDALMLHRAAHLSAWGGAVWERLLELQAQGTILELGASVQSPDELLMVLEAPEIRVVQLPYNVLDWRWDAVLPQLMQVRAQRKLTVHVRSALLQGLLLTDQEDLWCAANIANGAEARRWLSRHVEACGRRNIADLCLAYVSAMHWADGIALGMENMGQLLDNITYFDRPPLTAAQVEAIACSRPKISQRALDPSQWRGRGS